MKIHQFFLIAGIACLSGCAPYQLAPVDSIVDKTPVADHQIDYAFAEEPAPELQVIAEPTFKDLSPSAWTVQIAALKSLEKMGTVETNNNLDNVIHVQTHNAELGELHTVLVGVYDSLEDAQQTARNLPEKVAGDDPWIRRVASVQAVMR